MTDNPIWSGLTAQDLYQQYQTEVWIGIKEEKKYLNQFVKESRKYRERIGNPIVERYGESDAETLRIFQAKGEGLKPVLINLKGGYWRIPKANWVDFVAEGMNPKGVTVVNVDYGTMPTFSMKDLVDQVAKATKWVLENAEKLDFDINNVHMIGHSAGGHLSAAMRGNENLPENFIKSTICMSGVFDLGFALHGHLSQGERAIHLDAGQAVEFSPINMMPRGTAPIIFLVGENESEEFHRQAREIKDIWSKKGANCEFQSVTGKHHYSLYFDLHNPESEISKFVAGKIVKGE